MIVFFTACRRQPGYKPPSIQFETGAGFIFKDTVLKAGSPFRFGIMAGKGDNDLTNFQVRRTFLGGEEVILDTGIHKSSFIYSCFFSKGVYSSEVWYFRILDDMGQWSEVSFTLNNSSAHFDTVRFLPSVIMGAQRCSSVGSFFDLKNNLTYFQGQAFQIQDSIEMLYYYDTTGFANTISSPNAHIDSAIFPDPYGLLHWTLKNETRYYKTTISPSAFDAVVNDSLPIAAFDQLNSKRKARNLVPGDVYAFKTIHNKLGLFKTINVTGEETGTIEISIKMQK